MSAGVIQLTHNSATVLGYQASFSTVLQHGDFVVSVVGGIAYTLPVKSIESNDSLTLVSAFTGPTKDNGTGCSFTCDTEYGHCRNGGTEH